MDMRLREQVMVTVARANGCRMCSYIHQEWAIRAGVSDDEIAQLEGTHPAEFDRARWSAVGYARSLAENDFKQVPDQIFADAARYYSPGELRNIEVAALLMTMANRSVNTVDALFSRLRGVPVSQSLTSEIAITAALVAALPIGVPVLCLTLRKSPHRLVRDFRAFTDGEPTNSTR